MLWLVFWNGCFEAGYIPELKYIVTSSEAIESWKDLKLQYNWILCYENEIINVDAIKEKVKPQLLNLLKDNLVIMDCTSATKPATIAYYDLAQTLWIPLIYVYEDTTELKWLISIETLKERLTGLTWEKWSILSSWFIGFFNLLKTAISDSNTNLAFSTVILLWILTCFKTAFSNS